MVANSVYLKSFRTPMIRLITPLLPKIVVKSFAPSTKHAGDVPDILVQMFGKQ